MRSQPELNGATIFRLPGKVNFSKVRQHFIDRPSLLNKKRLSRVLQTFRSIESVTIISLGTVESRLRSLKNDNINASREAPPEDLESCHPQSFTR